MLQWQRRHSSAAAFHSSVSFSATTTTVSPPLPDPSPALHSGDRYAHRLLSQLSPTRTSQINTTSYSGLNRQYRKWKDNEEVILNDIEPIVYLTKDILHSNRYMDGERLTTEEEKVVVEKLLAYHRHSEDKIGCGLDSIIFRYSRCLFVVRTDGGWIDFSYQKCLREYIRNKYPSYGERFIREHLKRGRG